MRTGHHAGRTPAETVSVFMANMLAQHLLNQQVMGMICLFGFDCRLPTYGGDQSTPVVSAPRCEVRFQCGGNLPSATSNCKHWTRKTAAVALQTLKYSGRKTYSCLVAGIGAMHLSECRCVRPTIRASFRPSLCPGALPATCPFGRPSVRPSTW